MSEVAVASALTGIAMLLVVYLVLKPLWTLIKFVRGKTSFKSVTTTSLISVVLLSIIFGGLFNYVPALLDSTMNGLYATDYISVHQQDADWERALKLHNSFEFISDLHSDALMWSYRGSLLEAKTLGHVDIPRLQKGNVALQVFATVTKAPVTQNYENNGNNTDIFTAVAFSQRWPVSTWVSLTERVLYQGKRLEENAKQSDGIFTFVKTKQDLEQFTERRKSNKLLTAGLLAVEGAQALENKLETVDRLFNAGVRMFGLTHFFDNEVCGSRHGIEKYGLTEFGRKAVQRMLDLSMMIDLTHASDACISDTLELAGDLKSRILVSHTGLKGTCNNTRNLADDQVKAIAAKDGLIGITFFDAGICGTDIADLEKAILYAVNLVGAKHVALGSDFDGFVTTVVDPTLFSHITFRLLKAGLSEQDIELIMGGNVRKLFDVALPQ